MRFFYQVCWKVWGLGLAIDFHGKWHGVTGRFGPVYFMWYKDGDQ